MKVRIVVLALAASLAVLAFTGSTAFAASPPNVLSCDYNCGGGNINGNTHCFITWSHAGCQLNHTLSAEVVNYTIAGSLSAAGGVVCGAVTDASLGCAWIAGAIFYGVQGHITFMPYGDCLEVGYYYPLNPYAKRISCTVE